MIDISTFKPLLERGAYEKYKNVIFDIPSIDPELRSIIFAIKDYYAKYPEKNEITIDELKLHFNNINPVIKKPELYQDLIDRMYGSDITNVQLLIDSLNQLAEKSTANIIMQECLELVNNYKPGTITKINNHLEFHQRLIGSVSGSEADVCTLSFKEIARMMQNADGVNWELPFLADAVGALKAGTLAHIFAYSETGKTSLGVFEAVHYAKKLIYPDCVLYLGNEEPIWRTKFRAMEALTNRDENAILSNIDLAEKYWDDHIGDKLKMIDDARHIFKVEQYIADFKPKLVVIDQGTKVHIPGDLSEVKRLQELYNSYRQLSVNHNTRILTLGQAESSCANKKHLNLNNMDMSKVGIPGELDVAIGVGSTDEEGFEDVRWVSVCKNKLTGYKGRGQVYFNYKTCQWGMQRPDKNKKSY